MRPRGVSAIAWGWLGLGALLALGGALSALDEPVTTGDGDIFDFPSAHPVLMGVLVEIFAVAMILGALALLRLRRWGARVIEAVAWLGVAYLAAFALFATYLLVTMLLAGIRQHQPWFPLAFASMLVVNLGVLGTPLALTIRYLRLPQTRGALA
jgi:hypothetical protein